MAGVVLPGNKRNDSHRLAHDAAAAAATVFPRHENNTLGTWYNNATHGSQSKYTAKLRYNNVEL